MCVWRSISPGITVKRLEIDHLGAGRRRAGADRHDAIVLDDDHRVGDDLAGRIDDLARTNCLRRGEAQASRATATANEARTTTRDHEARSHEERNVSSSCTLRVFVSSWSRSASLMMRTSLSLPRTAPAISRASAAGATTRANGPKLRIQLWSARSRQTSSVIVTPPTRPSLEPAATDATPAPARSRRPPARTRSRHAREAPSARRASAGTRRRAGPRSA